MKVVAFDTETALIRPGLLAPPMVCLTYQRSGEEPVIVSHKQAEPVLRAWLEDPEVLLVGHNVAYDTAVVGAEYPSLVPLIFRAYEEDRVTDTKLREQLLDIAAGQFRGRLQDGKWRTVEYTLEAVARRRGGVTLQKDEWRLSYGHFRNVPLASWPTVARKLQADARVVLSEETDPKRLASLQSMVDGDPERCLTYPLDDARATLAVFAAQEQHADYLRDQYRQARAYFALHLSSCWGLRTDKEAVAKLTRETEDYLAKLQAELQAAGLVRADGSRDTKAAIARMVSVCKDEGRILRRTASHTDVCTDEDCHVALDADACQAIEDPVLESYAELSTAKKVLSTDCELLDAGTVVPVQPTYGLAETGRTTCTKPNIQNLRRRAGIRECFVPREGYVFAQADYPQLELYTLAQCCVSWVGQSALAKVINAGQDPHLMVAATILGISYEEAHANKKRQDVDNARQTGKVCNFGLPGGLGVDKLILFADKTYGVKLTRSRAIELKEQWFVSWPEMRAYFQLVNEWQSAPHPLIESLFTQRYRGGASYCASCNNGFQGLGADCAKQALWEVAQAQYVDRKSPLFGTRTVAFVHDEIIIEVKDDDRAHDAAFELSRLMVSGANRYLKDVPMALDRFEPTLMRRWSKKAEQVWEKGRLVPWG